MAPFFWEPFFPGPIFYMWESCLAGTVLQLAVIYVSSAGEYCWASFFLLQSVNVSFVQLLLFGNGEFRVTFASSKHSSVFLYNPIAFLQLASGYRDCLFLTVVGDLGPVCLLLIMYLHFACLVWIILEELGWWLLGSERPCCCKMTSFVNWQHQSCREHPSADQWFRCYRISSCK